MSLDETLHIDPALSDEMNNRAFVSNTHRRIDAIRWTAGMPTPAVGSECEIAGPNTDITCDQDRNFTRVKVLAYHGPFIVYGVDGCWPVVNRLEHCWFRAPDVEVALAARKQVGQ